MSGQPFQLPEGNSRTALGVRWRDLLAQARPGHWVKNILVFVPLLTAQQVYNAAAWPHVLLAFAAFCLAASAGYQLNDLIDAKADREHRTKRTRPLASGRLSTPAVLWLGMVLFAASLLLAFAVNASLAVIVGGYVALSALYSTLLKRVAVIDVLTLAALYCARVFAGAAAIAVVVSPYLLAFSLFFFLSLALMKRFIALTPPANGNGEALAVYGKADSTLLLVSGVAMAVISAGLLALYINDAEVRARYSSPDMLWGVWLVLLYALLRGWLWASRGKLEEDMVTAAMSDRALWIAGAVVVVFFMLAY